MIIKSLGITCVAVFFAYLAGLGSSLHAVAVVAFIAALMFIPAKSTPTPWEAWKNKSN